MSLPDPPSTFRRSGSVERPWSWRLEDAAGEPVSVTAELGEQRFSSQGDAESWLGETWMALRDAGVDQVSLLEHERTVYGPMSLHA